MKLYYDFHIHTALSPCASIDMSPNNIVNMALLKELDIIAITDHNSTENCKPCIEVAQDKDIIVIPGIELQTKEEVHLLCLFRTLNEACNFNSLIKKQMHFIKNNELIFGEQILFDKNDDIIGIEDRMLASSVNISIKETVDIVTSLNGIVIPAHIDRPSFSLISNLGFIPPDIQFSYLEVSKNYSSTNSNSNKNIRLNDAYNIIYNSDAHYLQDIMERVNYIEVKERSIESVFDFLLKRN